MLHGILRWHLMRSPIMRHCLNKRFQILVAETDKQIIYFYI